MSASVHGRFMAGAKMLRVGGRRVPRARWPKLIGTGQTTPNWLFSKSWSQSSSHPDRNGHPAKLGIDPGALPRGANISALKGAYAHVFGCIEKDVNSQMQKVFDVSDGTQPSLHILFAGQFTVNQRFYLENVRWALSEGEFFFDEAAERLYAWPLPGEDLSLMVVAAQQSLINVDRAEHVVLSNMSFADATYYADGYWDGPALQPTDAAIRMNRAQDVHVEACNFVANLGGYGVALGNASSSCSVKGCLFDRVGQGGVIAYGIDSSTSNSQPTDLLVSHNVMQDIGQALAHVAGVAFRSASRSVAAHNRVERCPRYGLQADSFYSNAAYGPRNSRHNIFEYNVLHDTNLLTTDTGAIEMIGSGDPKDIPETPWWNANTIRYNNISGTVGSSSSDGKSVCVHGMPDSSCRDLVWGIYLDGGEAGILMHGNVIGASLHGSIFDNAGGNNTQTNNLFLGNPESLVLMNFGGNDWPGSNNISGNLVQRNIFLSRSSSTTMMSAMGAWNKNLLKPTGSDFNLFWHPGMTASDFEHSTVFPGGLTFHEWQGSENVTGQITCAEGSAGHRSSLIVQEAPFMWRHNETDRRLYSAGDLDGIYTMNIDCEGSWAHCAEGGTDDTALCLHKSTSWNPKPIPPAVDNQGWLLVPIADGPLVQLQQVSNNRCLEICYRGGAVGGCNGEAGSIAQLASCNDKSPWQQWSFDGAKGTLALASSMLPDSSPLYLGPPPRPPSALNDMHSIIADPLFVDVEAGDFRLKPDSPALSLGFEPIPAIEAPAGRCSGETGNSCLGFVVSASALETVLLI